MAPPDASVIWLTGAGGFIGRHVVRALRPGTQVVPVTIDPQAAQASDGRIFLDVDDPGAIARLAERHGRPQTFIHLGWGGMTTPDSDVHLGENLQAGQRLIHGLYETGLARFILIGSIDEYGENTGLLREDMPAVGRLTQYAQAKRKLGEFGFAEAARAGRHYIHVRLTNTYGAGQRSGALLNKLYALHAGSEKVDLGPCDNYRDYIYVEEAAEGMARLCDVGASAVVNLGGGRSIQLRDFVLAAWRAMGADPKRINFGAITRRPDEPAQPQAWVDLGNLERLTGWKPVLSLDEGLRKTIAALGQAGRV